MGKPSLGRWCWWWVDGRKEGTCILTSAGTLAIAIPKKDREVDHKGAKLEELLLLGSSQQGPQSSGKTGEDGQRRKGLAPAQQFHPVLGIPPSLWE